MFFLSEKGGVVWKDLGESINITCRISDPQQSLLSLRRGLRRNEVLSTSKFNSDRTTISTEVKNRLEVSGHFPSLNLVISNLTMEDTGPYWCEYSEVGNTLFTKDGDGAVLLVVRGEPILR